MVKTEPIRKKITKVNTGKLDCKNQKNTHDSSFTHHTNAQLARGPKTPGSFLNIRELKARAFLRGGQKPEENISRVRTMVSPRF